MDEITLDILTLAALVASYGVVKGLGLSEKWMHLVALGVAAVFVLIPEFVRMTPLLIG